MPCATQAERLLDWTLAAEEEEEESDDGDPSPPPRIVTLAYVRGTDSADGCVLPSGVDDLDRPGRILAVPNDRHPAPPRELHVVTL